MSTPAQSLHGDRLDRVDARLIELVVGAARWRLAAGDALERLGRAGGVRALGFPSMAAYAVERCGYSGRWAEEARGLSRRLAALPNLRAALDAGWVTWSMAQLVARHATSETETELVGAARTMTLRAMRARLEPNRAEPPEPAPRRTLETVVPIEEAWGFERARMLVAAVSDLSSNDEVIEAMLAETMTSLLVAGDGALARAIDRAAFAATCRAEAQQVEVAVRERIEAAFEPGLAPRGTPSRDDAPMVDDEPEEPIAIDRRIARLCRELHGRDLAIGRLAREVRDTAAWRGFGYASFAHYGRERLGLSLTALESKLALARRCDDLPALGEAVRAGRLGQVGATLVGRVARAETAAAWVERASERTVRDLREDVEVAGLLARTTGDARRLAPPDDAEVEAVREMERRVLAGKDDVGPHMSVGREGKAGRVPLRVTVAADVADMWMAVRALHARSGAERSFVGALCDNIRRYWTAEDDRREFGAVYLRDRYRCASPVCRSRGDVGAHHVVFRAHGGSDAPENLITLCGTCHLEGVHAGNVRVGGSAPGGLAWRLGGGVVAVEGRRRVVASSGLSGQLG